LQPSASIKISNDDSFTVSIPNFRGGYTTVRIDRFGDGFMGPNGEYYPKFPTVSQLTDTYGEIP
jgi:hypothetical protein